MHTYMHKYLHANICVWKCVFLRVCVCVCAWSWRRNTSRNASLVWHVKRSPANEFILDTYIRTYKPYVHAHIHTYIDTSYVHAHIHTYIRTYTGHTYIHTHIHAYHRYMDRPWQEKDTYIHTYIRRTYIHAHTPTYIHTHTPTCTPQVYGQALAGKGYIAVLLGRCVCYVNTWIPVRISNFFRAPCFAYRCLGMFWKCLLFFWNMMICLWGIHGPFMYTCMYLWIHICRSIYIYIYIHTHTHTYTCIHTYIHS